MSERLILRLLTKVLLWFLGDKDFMCWSKVYVSYNLVLHIYIYTHMYVCVCIYIYYTVYICNIQY